MSAIIPKFVIVDIQIYISPTALKGAIVGYCFWFLLAIKQVRMIGIAQLWYLFEKVCKNETEIIAIGCAGLFNSNNISTRKGNSRSY